MKKLRNPFVGIEGYSCFGCAPENPLGLHMEFYEDGDELVSIWEPRAELQGYGGVLHGGIQATLMDEVAGWFVMAKLGTGGVTKSLQVQYLKPAPALNGPLTLRANLNSREGNSAFIQVALLDSAGETCSDGELEFFLYPEHIARRRLFFPGKEAFYP